MSKHHHYHLTVTWTGNKGQGTKDYTAYDRSHTVEVKGKKKLLCSSDSAFRGDKKKYNPEDMLLASLSACHMLWYLHLCADEGVEVLEYKDEAEAKMITTSSGAGYFTEVVLKPTVVVARSSMIRKALELHKKANHMCFIANSVKFEVYHKAHITAAEK
jgi:organic hydroperoxide reductase OsmC/OhrA